MRSERKIIECIIRINPLIFGLQDKIEKEQDVLIADMTSPAEWVVQRLIELDNRRIDLCNLVVLYGFIERGLGERFGILRSCAFSGEPCDLYGLAASQLAVAGYDAARCDREFSYLFKALKPIRRKKCVVGVALPRGDMRATRA